MPLTLTRRLLRGLALGWVALNLLLPILSEITQTAFRYGSDLEDPLVVIHGMSPLEADAAGRVKDVSTVFDFADGDVSLARSRLIWQPAGLCVVHMNASMCVDVGVSQAWFF